MKITKRTKHTSEYDQVVKIVCDLCKVEYPVGWSKDEHDDLESEVNLKLGRSWPGDAYGEIIEFDICPSCFQNRLIPWMKSQGAEPTKTVY